MLKKLLIILLFLSYLCFPAYELYLPFFSIFAVEMQSPRFKIQTADIDITSGATAYKKSRLYQIADIFGKEAQRQFETKGYYLKTSSNLDGIPNTLSLTLSDSLIKLPNQPSYQPTTSSTNLKINCDFPAPYQVTAIEEYLPKTLGGEVLDDTRCDGGENTCTRFAAKRWTLRSAFGFGYNLQGNAAPVDFLNSSFFRPFPNQNLGHQEVFIMSGPDCQRDNQLKITIKMNIPKTKPAASYETIIDLTTVLKF